MKWPSNEDCYSAMSQFVEYYMEGEQKLEWEGLIEEGMRTDRTPPGKGFLYELDKKIKTSGKESMSQHSELYQLTCTVCI